MVFTDRTISCYDIVSMVTEEATERFAPIWSVDETLREVLEKLCGAIDLLSDEFGGVAYECEVIDATKEISVSLICPEIIVLDNNHRIYNVMKYANRFSVYNTEDNECVNICFEFPGIWEETAEEDYNV